VLAYVVFPPRRLAVTADGTAIDVVSRQHDVAALLDSAGVKRDAGDVLVKSANEITVERAVPVMVGADGRTLSWRTRAETVGALLTELSIDVSPYDTVLYNGTAVSLNAQISTEPLTASTAAGGVTSSVGVDPVSIMVERAVPLTVMEDGRAISLESSKKTLGEVLKDAGIRLGPADEIYPAPSAPVTAGMHVEIHHAKTINLRIGDSTRVIYTQQTTLSAALAEAGLSFGADDRVEPALDAQVADGMDARLVRVAGETYSEREPVKHVTVFKPDDSLTGTSTRRVEGSDGVRVTQYNITIEDGVETGRNLSKQYYDPEPVNTIIYYSAASMQASGLAPGTLTVQRTLRMYGTWYNAASSGKAPTSASYGITASGAPLTKGIVAVDPSVIPLGTRLYIPGYGFAIAGDTGGGIEGNKIDLGFPDGVPVDWNTGWTDVYILSP
jgi:uncharacterized protein YabE (DUF348 family)/3D (Asp-Asp-Asp) domain-containing protein